MDSQSDNTTEKKQMEVVLEMPGEDEGLRAAAAAAPQPSSKDHINGPEAESLNDPSKEHGGREPPKPPSAFVASSPEIGVRPGHTPKKKPPLPPRSESLLRHRSMAKPKSRYDEPPLLPVSNLSRDGRPPAPDRSSGSPHRGSPKPKAPGTPKTPASVGEDEEEQEEETYKREEQSQGNGKRRRRWKFRTSIEWAILVLAMGCLIASLTVHRLQGSVIWGLEIWKWCLMVTVICCGRLVTQWLTTVLVFLIEWNFLFKEKVLYFVYGLKQSFQVCIWLALVLLSWFLVFNQSVARSPKTQKILNYVSRLLVSLLVGSVIWLVKTLLMKILASSFHRSRFFDRIRESFFHQYVLQTLSGAPVMESAEKVGPTKSSGQLGFRAGTGKGKGKGEELEVIDMAKLHKMKQEKVSAWKMKGWIDAIKSTGLSTISEAIDESFHEGGEQKEREINNEWDAKIAANRIFKNVAKEHHKYIDVDDLRRFLSEEEVAYVLPLFEGAAESGKIKKSALRNWVVKAYLDRKSLALSLNDTKTAVHQLHNLATAVVMIVIIIVTLVLMGVATTRVLVFISSQLLVVAFIFGNTCKTAFEAIVFVFVMHPFDVGDRCVVDGVQMTVEEMNILTTVFLRYDNEKIYYPNSVLSTKPISNFYRSPDMRDSVEFSVDVSTPVESIGKLKSQIKTYIESKHNHWHADHNIVVKDIVDVNKMNMVLNVQHTMNFQNIREKNSRRSDLVLALKKIFEDVKIQYRLLPQDVNLSYKSSTPLPMAIAQSV